MGRFINLPRPGVVALAMVCGLALMHEGRAQGERSRTEQLVTIKTGSPNGVYYPAGGAICRLVNQGRTQHRVRCALETSSGSIENVAAVLNNDADFGIVQSDVQFNAVRNQPGGSGLRALFSLHAEPFSVVARIDANVRSFEDLKGKRVGIGERGSGTRATMELILREHGLSSASFPSVLEIGPVQTGAALCENKIDAFVYVVGHPNGAIRNVMETCAATVVPVDGQPVRRLLSAHPYYVQTGIPGGLYPGADQEVATFGVRATVVVRDTMPEQVAYTVTRAVFEGLSNLKLLHPAFRNLTAAQLLQSNTAPFHPGALRYFREAGLQAR